MKHKSSATTMTGPLTVSLDTAGYPLKIDSPYEPAISFAKSGAAQGYIGFKDYKPTYTTYSGQMYTLVHDGNYNDADHADTQPTQDSTKLITSGAVYQAVKNCLGPVAIDFDLLASLDGKSDATQTAMDGLGLTAEAIEGIMNGVYTKVIGKGQLREVWGYTAYETSDRLSIQLYQGEGYDVKNGYSLEKNTTTGLWTIIYSEI